MPLRNVPDVIGLVGRREGAAESRVLQGRDICSVLVLVPDCRGVDQNCHDVTIVDMGEVSESSVSIPELSALSQQWPPAVISHMGWRQKELEEMRSAAKQRFRQSRPSSCVYCGSLIKCDMYRHVARFHLDLAQLWRCPVSWCTVWKGTPQDCMNHLRGAHDVPSEVKLSSLEKYLPPWTVTRQVWSDSLSAQHSGILTDVLLFSDSTCHWFTTIGYTNEVSITSHSGGTTCRSCALLPLPVLSPDSSGSGSFRPGDSPDVVDRSPRTTRRAYRRRRPVCVMEPPVVNLPVLTIQDPLAAAGAVVLDCRPPFLPVSMDIRGVDLSAGQFPAVSAGMDVLLHGREPMSSGGDLLGLICPEDGVAPLVDPGTDLEDERPTPVSSPSSAVDESMPLSMTSGVDLEVAHLASDGDAHCGSCRGVFHDPGDISRAPGSDVVVRRLGSAGGDFSC